MEQQFEKAKNAIIQNIETQQERLDKTQRQLDEAIQGGETKKIELYIRRIENIEKRVANMQNQLKYMRPDTQQDAKERLDVQNAFAKSINKAIPNGEPVVFHGNNDIAVVHEIIRSAGLKTPEDRGVDFRSFATQIDVANKYDIHVPVEFAEPGISSCRPYGAIFAFLPKPEEYEKVVHPCGSEVYQGVQSVDFKTEPERFVGVITTAENKERIQGWLQEAGIDSSKVYTHAEFLDACKEKYLKRGMEVKDSSRNEQSNALLSPHRTAESKVFENQETYKLADFVDAGTTLGMEAAVLAYMDEAMRSGKTITELSEEIAESYNANPKATREAVKEMSKGAFEADSKGRFEFQSDIGANIVLSDQPMTLTVFSKDNWMVERSELSFVANEQNRIEQTAKTTEYKEVGNPGRKEPACETFYREKDLSAESESVARLDKNGHIFDVTEKMYSTEDPDHTTPDVTREIVLNNGDTFYLSQSEPGIVTEIKDKDGNIAYLDGDIDAAEVSYEDIRAALYGSDEVENDTPDFNFDLETN